MFIYTTDDIINAFVAAVYTVKNIAGVVLGMFVFSVKASWMFFYKCLGLHRRNLWSQEVAHFVVDAHKQINEG